MSDSFQSYVFSAEPETKAGDVAKSVSDWMIGSGVMSRDVFDNVLGPDDEGHVPGVNAGNFVEAGMSETRGLAVNGVEVRVGHAVEAAGGEWRVKCPKCAATFDEEDAQIPRLMDAVDAWYERKVARVVCRNCNQASEITEWDFGDKLALGNVIVRFWNWPRLRETLRAGLEKAAGMRSKMVVGRL